MKRVRQATSTAAGVLVLAMLQGGCSSMPSLSSPFASKTSDFDRTFIGAAQTWDIDKDGLVTCEEWKKYAGTLLSESDANADDALAAEEFAKMAKTDRLFELADFKYYDQNGDGKVTRDELTGKPNQAFKLLDKNGDCQIARDESVQVMARDTGNKPADTSVPDTTQSRQGNIPSARR